MTVAVVKATLANAGFYQAAASILGVLLLSGVLAEVRLSKDRQEAGHNQTTSLYIFLGLSIVVLVGVLASLTALLQQRTSGFLQLVAGLALIAGLFGVPTMTFVEVAGLVADRAARRRASRAARITLIAGACVTAGFVAQSLISGKPGVGTPVQLQTAANSPPQIAATMQASLNHEPFTDTLSVPLGAQVTVAVTVHNPSYSTDPHVRVLISVPSGPAPRLSIEGIVSGPGLQVSPQTAATTLVIRGGGRACLSYVHGSAVLFNGQSRRLSSLPDEVVGVGTEIGALTAKDNIRFVEFRISVTGCGP